MNDTTTGEDPIGTRPAGETAPDQPSESPLADAPIEAAPDLSEQLADPAAGLSAAGLSADEMPDETLPLAETDTWAEVLPDLVPGELSPAEALPDDTPPNDAPPAAAPVAETPADHPPQSRPLSRGEREVVERARLRFAACGRCGYLIADMQLLLGEAALQTAMIQARDGWLRLEGDERLRTLLGDAFGVRLDLDYDMMDGACPECRRRFVFAALDDGRARVKLHL